MIKMVGVMKTDIINNDLNETLGKGYVTSISEKEANIESSLELEEGKVIFMRFANEISKAIAARIKSKEKLMMDFKRYNVEFLNIDQNTIKEITVLMSKQ